MRMSRERVFLYAALALVWLSGGLIGASGSGIGWILSFPVMLTGSLFIVEKLERERPMLSPGNPVRYYRPVLLSESNRYLANGWREVARETKPSVPEPILLMQAPEE